MAGNARSKQPPSGVLFQPKPPSACQVAVCEADHNGPPLEQSVLRRWRAGINGWLAASVRLWVRVYGGLQGLMLRLEQAYQRRPWDPLPFEQTASNCKQGLFTNTLRATDTQGMGNPPLPVFCLPPLADDNHHHSRPPQQDRVNQAVGLDCVQQTTCPNLPAGAQSGEPSNRCPSHPLAASMFRQEGDSSMRPRDSQQPSSSAASPQRISRLLQLGQWQQAIPLLEQYAEAHPTQKQPLIQLVQYYSEKGPAIRCLYYMRRLLNLEPQNPQYHLRLAETLEALQDMDGAIEAYRTAMVFGQSPTWTAAVAKTLSLLYYQQKHDMSAAVRCLQTALELDSNNPELLTTLADMYFEQGDYRAAAQVYELLLNVDPQNASLHTYLGYLYWQLDETALAIDAYERAIHLDGTDAVAFNNLGVIYLDTQHDAARAHPYFCRAFELKPDYTMACFNMARTLEALSRVEDARTAYQRAARLNSQSAELPPEEITHRLLNL